MSTFISTIFKIDFWKYVFGSFHLKGQSERDLQRNSKILPKNPQNSIMPSFPKRTIFWNLFPKIFKNRRKSQSQEGKALLGYHAKGHIQNLEKPRKRWKLSLLKGINVFSRWIGNHPSTPSLSLSLGFHTFRNSSRVRSWRLGKHAKLISSSSNFLVFRSRKVNLQKIVNEYETFMMPSGCIFSDGDIFSLKIVFSEDVRFLVIGFHF